jgi:hypothetical protein
MEINDLPCVGRVRQRLVEPSQLRIVERRCLECDERDALTRRPMAVKKTCAPMLKGA